MKKVIAAVLVSAMLLAGCTNTKNDKSDVILTVGSVSVTQNDYDYVLKLYRSTYGEQTGDEEQMKDYIKEKAMCVEAAKNDGVKFDEDEMKKSKDAIVQSMGGEAKYKEMLKGKGVDEDFMDMLWVEYDIANKALMEKVDTNITDEQREEYFKTKYYRAKHILCSTVDTLMSPLPEDQLKAAKDKADDLYKKALDGENFDELMQNSDDPGLSSNPDGYVFTEGEMVPEFQEGVVSLEPGGIKMVESPYGYHIIKRLALDEDSAVYQKEYEKAKSKIDNNIKAQRLKEYVEKILTEKGIEVK